MNDFFVESPAAGLVTDDQVEGVLRNLGNLSAERDDFGLVRHDLLGLAVAQSVTE